MHRTLNKGLLLFLLAVLLPRAVPGVSAAKRFALPAPEQIEKELLEMINLDRERLGRKPLLSHPLLQEIARSHSAKMAAEGELSHHFPNWPSPEQKLRLGNVYFLTNAENVAYSPSPYAASIHEALMGSAMHRMNILDERMLQAGIAVCQAGNGYYVSEEFAAIIDFPATDMVRTAMENDLCRWYKEKFNRLPVIFVAARSLATVSAQQFLIGNPMPLEPLSDRKTQGINMCYNDMDTILAELKKEIKSSVIQAMAVGVAWGRNTSFPGGTYSVCLLLFE
ncbi:MAG TPA: CAP domain-containing protein [Acidobacteriota bacterium]